MIIILSDKSVEIAGGYNKEHLPIAAALVSMLAKLSKLTMIQLQLGGAAPAVSIALLETNVKSLDMWPSGYRPPICILYLYGYGLRRLNTAARADMVRISFSLA